MSSIELIPLSAVLPSLRIVFPKGSVKIRVVLTFPLTLSRILFVAAFGERSFCILKFYCIQHH
ncbi:hypothetical protein [Leptospira interrogans]|uniref:hypothetical protein n=1 Tax=Leptospira interrogans TaxID=173 RepID=UPI0012B524AC|nr:hypothetical protein [Leptospira interrogans]